MRFIDRNQILSSYLNFRISTTHLRWKLRGIPWDWDFPLTEVQRPQHPGRTSSGSRKYFPCSLPGRRADWGLETSCWRCPESRCPDWVSARPWTSSGPPLVWPRCRSAASLTTAATPGVFSQHLGAEPPLWGATATALCPGLPWRLSSRPDGLPSLHLHRGRISPCAAGSPWT